MAATELVCPYEELDCHLAIDGCSPEVCMEQETFTVADRKELMRLGILFDGIKQSILEIQQGIKLGVDKLEREKADRSELALNVVTDHEKRIRALEDAKLEFKTQLRSSLWWIALLAAAVGSSAGEIMRALTRNLVK